MEEHIQFKDCRVLRNGQLINEDLWVSQGKIVDGQKWFFGQQTKATRVIDCRGSILAPGFIDIQINGGYGVDFSSTSPDHTLEEGLSLVSKRLLETGVTDFCPTLISSSPETYKTVLPKIKRKKGSIEGAGIIGVHLEGPFIAKNKKGAHAIEHVRDLGLAVAEDGNATGVDMAAVEASVLSTYGNLDDVAMVTIAPEMPYAQEMIKVLKNRGIKVSIGHTESSLATAELAVTSGATLVTHLFNAMGPFHHRDPGVVGLLGSTLKDQIFYGIIVDGHHTNNAAIRIAHATHPNGCVLVSDAMAAMGLKAGLHKLGDINVSLSEDNKAVVEGKPGTLAGSAASMDLCVRNFAKIVGRCAALEAASLHPAQAIGVSDRKGSLLAGFDADIVMLDDDLNVLATYVEGQLCWASDEHKPTWFYAPQMPTPTKP